MSESFPETGSGDPDDPFLTALIGFTGCMGEALEGICSYSLTVGEMYFPFNPDDDDDCDEDDAACEQVWVRVTDITPTATEGWDDNCAVVLRIGLEVGVLRCIQMPDGGEAATASEVLGYAVQAMQDMKKLFCAAMSCEVWDSIDAGAWSPMGPMGGQYGGTWTFTVEV